MSVAPRKGVECFDPGEPRSGKISNDTGHGRVLFCSLGSEIGLSKGVRFSLWRAERGKKKNKKTTIIVMREKPKKWISFDSFLLLLCQIVFKSLEY